MQIKVGMELNNEGRALAWALNVPGCFAYGPDGPTAIISLARELAAQQVWANRCAGKTWIDLGNFDLRIIETWDVFTINEQYEFQEGGYAVNAWFLDDWRPLEEEEVQRGLQMLAWTRADLFEVLSGASDTALDAAQPGERWSARGVARHIANAEWWYLNRFELAEGGREAVPKELTPRLTWVRERLVIALTEMTGQNRVVGKEGEFWSPRKLLRRALWHEIDHTRHIQRLLSIKNL